MTQVFLTSASTSPWSRPGNFTDAGHTVNLLGAGGRGGAGNGGTTTYRSGSGGGGGQHVLLTFSSGTLGATTAFAISVDAAVAANSTTISTIWQNTTRASGSGHSAGNGGVGAAGGVGTAGGAAGSGTANYGTPTPVTYTISQSNAGGAGGAGFAILGGAAGGGGAGGPSGVGAVGGATNTVTASRGAGGGGGANGGTAGAAAASATGGNGGTVGGTGAGTGGATTGGASAAGTGGGGGGGGFSATASVNVTGGAGSGTTSLDATHGSGGGGGGGGASSSTSGTATTTGGAGGDYGGGGGGGGGTRSATGNRNGGVGGGGLVAITYTPGAVNTNIVPPVDDVVIDSQAPTVVVADPNAPFVRSVNKKVYAAQVNTVVPAPASIVAGDALVVILTVGASTSVPSHTPPAGFTLQQTSAQAQDASAFVTRNYIYTKLATGSEPSTYTFTHTSASTEATILAVGNAHTAITNFSSNVTNTSGSAATATSIDTNQNGALVFFVSQNWGDASTQMTPPSGSNPTFTEWMDAPNTSLQYVAAGILATRGPTGDKLQIVNSASNQPSVGMLFEMDKATNVVEFTRTLTATYPHVEGYTMRMRIEPYRLVGMTAGTSSIAVSFLFGALTSGNIAAAYIGHASPTGDGYDFDGSQAQLTFAGSGSVAVSGAQTKTSDAATFAFDPTKALIISAAFTGTRVDLAAFGG